MSQCLPTLRLVGRESEIRLVDALLDGVRERGAAVVVRGEAGIGKSALLAEAARLGSVRGMQVLMTAGVMSESRLPFAGLHQLLRPILGRAESLPVPQRDAVLAAFGMSDAPAPDLFRIALAVLDLVGEAATEVPILLVVEDAHWLDRSSADILAFVARRLDAEPVVLIAAIRDGFATTVDDAGLVELRLERLGDTAAAALLDARAPGVPSAVREQLLREAAGNPLALVELPIGLERLGHAALPPAWLPLTTRLTQAFSARVHGLPVDTRTLLLIAALNDADLLSETLGAGAVLVGRALTADDLEPAVAVGLVGITDDRLRFRHPLMRSAMHQSASSAQRREAHAGLARVLAQNERQVWHRAASTVGPDEDVAGELEAAAVRALRRGGVEAAVAATERAADLTAEPGLRVVRLLGAAELAIELGRHDIVMRLLGSADKLETSPRQRARMAWIRGSFDEAGDHGPGARHLTDLAEHVGADGDTDLALKVLWGAALRCYWSDPGREARALVVSAAERVAVDEGDPRLLSILAFAAPIERGAVVIRHLHRHADDGGADAAAARLLGNAGTAVGAYDLASTFFAASIAGLRAQGRLGILARALTAHAGSAGQLVDLSVAVPAAEEATRLAAETSQPAVRALARSYEARFAALRGESDRAEALAAESERESVASGTSLVLASVQLARGLSALGDGRYVDAYEHLRRMQDPTDPAHHRMIRWSAVCYLAEAAVHCGQGDAIGDVMTEMERLAWVTPSPTLHAGLRYARAVLADDSDAEPLYADVLAADLARWPFARARAQLAYGEWLRRQRRVAESRAPLRNARETFDALGTHPWSERARQELRASGETSRRRRPEAREHLTPQELQIARMAAGGLTNRDIGEKLYLSHRTVSSHLHRIFPKLGVTSRTALAAAIRTPL